MKFSLWPKPISPDIPSGPTSKQKLLFIEDLPLDPPDQLNFYRKPHLHNVDVVLLIGAARCHGINTPILMYDGTIKMVQDIEVGDQLMGPDSKPRNVLSLARGKEKMYRIIPTKGESFICNQSHILSLKTSGLRIKTWGSGSVRKTTYSTGDVVNVSIKDYIKWGKVKQQNHKLWKSNQVTFNQNKILSIDPYYLGLFLGDGSSAHPNEIYSADLEIRDYLKSYSKQMSLEYQEYKQSGCYKCTITGKDYSFSRAHNAPVATSKFRDKFKNLNLLNNKHIPHEYLTASVEDRLQLLAGIIDTDGYLAHNSYYEVMQKNDVLAQDICFLVRSLGFAANLSPTLKGCWYKGEYKEDIYNRINICGDIDRIPVKLERKKRTENHKQHFNPLCMNFFIEELEEDNYYGFTIDSDHLYLTGDFTVHHNSGKSLVTCIKVIKFLLDNPGSVGILGAANRPLLFRSAVKIIQNMFSEITPWDHIKLPNRLITRKPTITDPRIDFSNGSILYLLHFSEPEILKGIDADIIGFEEADLLKDEGAFEELLARLSGKKGPLRQLIINTNPVKASRGWIKDKFKLGQLKPGFTGIVENIVSPCTCNICQYCLNARLGEWPFQDDNGQITTKKGSKCSNTKCAFLIRMEEMAISNPNILIKSFIKDNDCPGEQVFYRVIQTASSDNIHIPSDYTQSASRGMSKETAAAMVYGEITENTEGLVYSAFSDDNVLKVAERLDLNKDLLWSLDFNYDPQCSVVCQETETDQGYKLTVIDEIVKWSALPEHVAKIFCSKFHKFKFTDKEVLLYSDPSGLYGGVGDYKPTMYQTIVDILRKPTNEYGEYDPENGASFKVKVMMRVDPKPYTDKTREKIKVFVSERVDSVNAMLKNADGEIRLFVNGDCKNLITSLEGVEWAADGQSIFKKVDEYAKKKSKDIVRVMTHPSDALGYLVAKRFPLLRNKKGYILIQTPGETATIYREGKFEERIRTEHSKRLNKKLQDKNDIREQKRIDKFLEKEERKRRKEQSLGSMIDKMRKNPYGFNPFLF